MKLEKLLVELGKYSLILIVLGVFVVISVKSPLVLKFHIGYICGYIICNLSRYLDNKIKQ